MVNLSLAVPQNRQRQRQRQQQAQLQLRQQIDDQTQQQQPVGGTDGVIDVNDPDVKRAIEDVFTTPVPPLRKPGFADIVTPDPNFRPTTSPQTFVTNQQECTCVPYHLCDPSNNTANSQVNNDAVIGFGVIDIRFDPNDCVDILDVCCAGASRREESIVPKQEEDKPTRASGCGIRNVGGLDFKITGDFVSVQFIISLYSDSFNCFNFS